MPFIFVWFSLMHLFFFAVAWLAHESGWIQITEVTDGYITYRPFYYYLRAVFFLLFFLLFFYVFGLKLVWAWYLDGWAFEAAIVLLFFILGDILFITAKSAVAFAGSHQAFKVTYIILRSLFICSLLIRIICGPAIERLIADNPEIPAWFKPIPEIRPADACILDNYFIAYSRQKGFVIEKKVFMFRKDIWVMTGCFAHPSQYGLDYKQPDVNLFPRIRRYDNYTKILTDPDWYKASYMDFKIDSAGRLQMNSYQVHEGDKDCHLCGTMYLK